MQLAPIAPVSTPAPSTYVGLRVSTDREFSAPMFADRVQPLRAGSLTSALVEARELLAGGAFDGPRDAANGVVLLADEAGSSFRAGALVERGHGGSFPVAVPKANAHFEYWYEPAAVAVLDADEFSLTR